MDTNVLVVLHGRTWGDFFYIEGHIPCAFVGIGDGTVDVDFGIEGGNGWRTWIAWVEMAGELGSPG